MMGKNCRVCGREFEPTPNQIKKSDFMCRECFRAYWREGYHTRGYRGGLNWDPAKKAEWAKAYYANPTVKARKAALMRKRNSQPEAQIRQHARRVVRTALQRGLVARQSCVVCSSETSVAHHVDYTQPLNVTWLCRHCHDEYHAKAKGGRL